MIAKCLVMALLLQTSLVAARNEECTGSECAEEADDVAMLQTKSEKLDDNIELHKDLRKTRQELVEAHQRIGLPQAELKEDEVEEKEEQEGEVKENEDAEWGKAITKWRKKSRPKLIPQRRRRS